MKSVIDLIGNTPMVKLRNIGRGISDNIYAKAEHMNPGGSLKDRIALYILRKAEEEGLLNKNSIILEVSSGNTGIAFAMVGTSMGYRVRIMLPRSVSVERRHAIACYGAECELIESLLKMKDAIGIAEEIAARDPNIFLPRQFANPNNPKCHYETTGREILQQHPEKIDAFVMGVGTGGTLMGVGRRLREVYPDVRIVAVEPTESAVMSGQKPGCHGIQGFADGFIPEVVKLNEIDKIVTVSTKEATEMAQRLCREECLLVGISAGANVVASLHVAKEMGPDAHIVTVLPDRGERYFSLWYDSEGREKEPPR